MHVGTRICTVLVLTAAAWSLSSRISAAIEIGDVVLVKDNTDLRVPGAKTGAVTVGDYLIVEKTQDKWLWVKPDANGKPGWIDSASVVAHEKAMDYFSGRINKNSRDAAAFAGRAKMLQASFEWEKALADFSKAIELGFKSADIYCQRGMLSAMNEKLEEALSDFEQALRLDRNHEETFGYRGLIWLEKGQYGKALADLKQAHALKPDDAENCSALALLYASCPDAKIRNGKEAVTLAMKACQASEWQVGSHLSALAAAYAETGDFKKAVEHGQKAIELAHESEKAEARASLALYQAGKPHRHQASEK